MTRSWRRSRILTSYESSESRTWPVMRVKIKPAPVRPKKTTVPAADKKPEPRLAVGKIGEGRTIGKLIDQLQRCRERKSKAQAALDAAIAAYTEQETEVLRALNAQKLAGARGRGYQAN